MKPILHSPKSQGKIFLTLVSFFSLSYFVYLTEGYNKLSLVVFALFIFSFHVLKVHAINFFVKFFFTLFFILASWSYHIEGKIFGEGFWAHIGTGNFHYLLLNRKLVFITGILLLISFFQPFLKASKSLLRLPHKAALPLSGLMLLLGPLWALEKPFKLLSYHLAPVQKGTFVQNPNYQYFFKRNVDYGEAKSKKNIIFLILEGVEKEYLNEKRYPGLMPGLKKLKEGGLFFSNFKEQPGGWTIGGLLASTCGIYITALSDMVFGNEILKKASTSSLNCLGDMLSKAGWENFFFQGSDLRFANTGRIFNDHRTKVSGIESFEKDEIYQIAAYDYYLFRKVEGFIGDRLKSGSEQPFFLTMINHDTHAPGVVGPKCRGYGSKNEIVNAVHCLDQEVTRFFSFLEDKGILDDTILFIFSDHLSMANFNELDRNKRRNILLVLGAAEKGVNDLTIFHTDIPQILSNMIFNRVQAFPISTDPILEKKSNSLEFNPELTKGLIQYMQEAIK